MYLWYCKDNSITDEVTLFCHIPKTSGTTFTDILTRYYIYKYVLSLENGFKHDFDKLNNVRLIGGHFDFGFHTRLRKTKFNYITFLRNPVDRIISSYYYAKELKYHNFHKRFNEISLLEYVSDDEFNCTHFPSVTTNDCQTRMIAGNNENDLNKAKENLLNYFSFVGISELFDYSLKKFAKLNPDIDLSYDKKMVTKKRPTLDQVSDEIKEIIIQKNQKDLELYYFAKNILRNY